MRKISFNELRETQLLILNHLDTFCRENEIRYSLFAGTLLGAIRHGGYIPWDDDIDIVLPRPDYERLLRTCKHSEITFFTRHQPKRYFKPFSRAILKNQGISDPTRYGFHVDVFPVDGTSDNTEVAYEHILSAERMYHAHLLHFGRRLLTPKRLLKRWQKDPDRTKKEKIYDLREMLVIPCFNILQPLIEPILTKKLILQENRYSFGETRHAAMLCDFVHIIYPLDIFLSYTEVEFENRKYMAITNYKTYLEKRYGDYMTPPPPEERIRHQFETEICSQIPKSSTISENYP